jgi:hypothetical protein
VQIKSVGKKGPYLVAFHDKQRRKSKRQKDFADRSSNLVDKGGGMAYSFWRSAEPCGAET